MGVDVNIKNSLIFQFVYLVLYCILCVAEVFIVSDYVLLTAGGIGVTYILIHTFFIKYNRDWLFVNGLLSAFIVLQLGVLMAKYVISEMIIVMGTAISITDVISFTKAGKYTLNGRTMSNATIMYKLLVYGKGSGDALYSTCGIGDYFHYAFWIAGLISLTDKVLCFIIGSMLIIIGTFVNSFIVRKIYTKDTYKGIPATAIPFACISIEYVILYFT